MAKGYFRIGPKSMASCAKGLAALCFALIQGSVAAAGSESLENSVKAAYLAKFVLFIEWPPTAFASSNSPLTLCIAGEDPFGPVLDKAVSDQRVGNRAMVVVRPKVIGRDSGCHVLYVGVAEKLPSSIVGAMHSNGVLTVSDGRGPASAAAVINFVIKDNRVRFDIDEDAAARNGLTISSKLLSLALNVKRKTAEEPR